MTYQLSPSAPTTSDFSWVQVASGSPYFATESGHVWTPIGQNDAVSWVDLNGLFRRRDVPAVERYLDSLVEHGVTCLRLMLECSHARHRSLESPVGRWVPNLVRTWDDLFTLCEQRHLRLMLTPYDTFWMWKRWRHHPYNRVNGGCLATMEEALLCSDTRAAIKARYTFAIERWGGSPALFAWDLWNEIHPAHARNSIDCWMDFIADLSDHVRSLELRLYGRSHPQTVSIFGPELTRPGGFSPTEPIFRHPSLDFASLHMYEHGTIDDPADTVAAALAVGRIVQRALAEIRDDRPFLDTEHGPIHRFKDKKKTMSEAFDDEYFRHMQWAHLASGGVGGGMRWPNRHPHSLTSGMRGAQRGLATFLPLIDWATFRRRCLNGSLQVEGDTAHVLGCGDRTQAVLWMVRRDNFRSDGRLDGNAPAARVTVSVPGLEPGTYRLTPFDTSSGVALAVLDVQHEAEHLPVPVELTTDVAVAVRRL